VKIRQSNGYLKIDVLGFSVLYSSGVPLALLDKNRGEFKISDYSRTRDGRRDLERFKRENRKFFSSNNVVIRSVDRVSLSDEILRIGGERE